MSMSVRSVFARRLLVALGALHAAGALAEDHHAPIPVHPAWQAECGSCHLAYPPRMLAADSWRTVMQGLQRHFGVDATLDARTAASIGAFLEANAGRPGAKRVESSGIRITDARWFRREHGGIPETTWTSPGVRSASNCSACHADAARGTFSERRVRIPAP